MGRANTKLLPALPQDGEPDVSGLVVVTVTYRPDLVILARQLNQLPDKAVKIVVDNASEAMVLYSSENNRVPLD